MNINGTACFVLCVIAFACGHPVLGIILLLCAACGGIKT